MNRLLGSFGVLWGVGGLSGLLLFAIYRLSLKSIEAYAYGLTPLQWALAVATVLSMAYLEGYRGFQQRFSPRTAARIRHLRERPSLPHVLLAPLFAMGYFHATRRTKIAAYGLSLGIAILVGLVNRLAQPWRGIVDAGVVVGLSWGLVSLVCSIVAALSRAEYRFSPEVPALDKSLQRGR